MSASGLTWLQIINRVLARLREDAVAANDSTTYSAFIGSLVNQVKAEIEDAYRWNAMRDTYAVTCVAGTATYALTGSGMNTSIINGWNTTYPRELIRGTNAQFDRNFFGVSSVQTGVVTHYIPAGYDANYDTKIDLFPVPSGTDALKFNTYTPQADLSADATVPLCPQSVLIEETIARAMLERGDEGAPQPAPGETFIRRDLLDSAIARESAHDDTEQDWIPE